MELEETKQKQSGGGDLERTNNDARGILWYYSSLIIYEEGIGLLFERRCAGLGGGWQGMRQPPPELFPLFVRKYYCVCMEGEKEETCLETWFGETGLKIQPDVFRHDNCERI